MWHFQRAISQSYVILGPNGSSKTGTIDLSVATADAETIAGSAAPRSILVVSSGVDRAVDSAGFFTQALAGSNPLLGSLLVQPPAPVGYPSNAPLVQPAGTNRFLLYFHKLVLKTDQVTSASDQYYQTYRDSRRFVRVHGHPSTRCRAPRLPGYATDADLVSKVSEPLRHGGGARPAGRPI